MKKAWLWCVLAALLLTGCGAPASSSQVVQVMQVAHSSQAQAQSVDDEVLYVQEPYLDAQCRDILTHPEDYAGTTICIEGMYYSWDDVLCGIRHSVVRYCQDGCCGGGLTGLEIFYEGEVPAADAWVKVTGTMEVLPLEGYPLPFPLLRVTQIEVMEERGNERVYN